jgi:hypothetical protein
MRVKQVASRIPVSLGFLAISGALFFRGTQFYRAPWAGLAPLSAVFLALAIPWIVSALRAWNVYYLHAWMFVILFVLPWGFMIAGAMAASAHHASDFTAHAVARTGTLTAVTTQYSTDSDGEPVGVTLALAPPVAGRHTVDLQLPYRTDYAAGDHVAVLVDPRHPDDVELPGHQGWQTIEVVLGWIAVAGLAGCVIGIVKAMLGEGPSTDEEREADFLDATWRSWAEWRAEPQDLIPWTAAVRAVAWLPFFAITALVVNATVNWRLWWLLLLPAPPVAIVSAAAAVRRSFPRFRDAALPLASLSAAAAAPVLLITGTLPPAAGVPLTAAAWVAGIIAMSATGRGAVRGYME